MMARNGHIIHLAYVGVGTMTRSPGSEIIQARASNPPLTPFTIRKLSADSFSPLMEGEVQIVLMLTKIARRNIPQRVSPAESWW